MSPPPPSLRGGGVAATSRSYFVRVPCVHGGREAVVRMIGKDDVASSASIISVEVNLPVEAGVGALPRSARSTAEETCAYSSGPSNGGVTSDQISMLPNASAATS